MHLEALSIQPAGSPRSAAAENTATMAVPSGAPAPTQTPQGGMSSWVSFLPMLMILPIFFLMNRKGKKETEARARLKKGDQIASQSGLVGELIEMDERFAKVKIGPGVVVKMLTSSLTPLEAERAPKNDNKSEKSGDKAAAASVK